METLTVKQWIDRLQEDGDTESACWLIELFGHRYEGERDKPLSRNTVVEVTQEAMLRFRHDLIYAPWPCKDAFEHFLKEGRDLLTMLCSDAAKRGFPLDQPAILGAMDGFVLERKAHVALAGKV